VTTVGPGKWTKLNGDLRSLAKGIRIPARVRPPVTHALRH